MVAALALLSFYLLPSHGETVNVKYRGPVDLKSFACNDISRSSFITRVCYDRAERYMIIRLNAIYYHYCELPPAILRTFLDAPSMGSFYNQRIKGTGLDGPFDCRTHPVPEY
ncbi:KTSC domain-containing protein [Bradyrhizobium sp. LCT2]|nr:KTSC domain-containing protein [Bradyrhizobium sp. LCT2]